MSGKGRPFFPAAFDWSNSLGNIRQDLYYYSRRPRLVGAIDGIFPLVRSSVYLPLVAHYVYQYLSIYSDISFKGRHERGLNLAATRLE